MPTDLVENHQQADTMKIYSTAWCGYCQRLKAQLHRAGLTFSEIDIENDPAAADFVASVNGGNMTVPTVSLPDGRVLTNPPLAEVLSGLGIGDSR